MFHFGDHISLFLRFPWLCVGLYALEKADTSTSLHGLVPYRIGPSLVSVARDSGCLSDLLCVGIFSGLVCVNSQLEEFAGLFISYFQEFVLSFFLLCLSAVLWILWCSSTLQTLFPFSVAPRHLEYAGSWDSRDWSQCLGWSPEKSKYWMYISVFSFPPQRKARSSESCWRWISGRWLHTGPKHHYSQLSPGIWSMPCPLSTARQVRQNPFSWAATGKDRILSTWSKSFLSREKLRSEAFQQLSLCWARKRSYGKCFPAGPNCHLCFQWFSGG